VSTWHLPFAKPSDEASPCNQSRTRKEISELNTLAAFPVRDLYTLVTAHRTSPNRSDGYSSPKNTFISIQNRFTRTPCPFLRHAPVISANTHKSTLSPVSLPQVSLPVPPGSLVTPRSSPSPCSYPVSLNGKCSAAFPPPDCAMALNIHRPKRRRLQDRGFQACSRSNDFLGKIVPPRTEIRRTAAPLTHAFARRTWRRGSPLFVVATSQSLDCAFFRLTLVHHTNYSAPIS